MSSSCFRHTHAVRFCFPKIADRSREANDRLARCYLSLQPRSTKLESMSSNRPILLLLKTHAQSITLRRPPFDPLRPFTLTARSCRSAHDPTLIPDTNPDPAGPILPRSNPDPTHAPMPLSLRRSFYLAGDAITVHGAAITGRWGGRRHRSRSPTTKVH